MTAELYYRGGYPIGAIIVTDDGERVGMTIARIDDEGYVTLLGDEGECAAGGRLDTSKHNWQGTWFVNRGVGKGCGVLSIEWYSSGPVQTTTNYKGVPLVQGVHLPCSHET